MIENCESSSLAQDAEPTAPDQLLPLVYQELRQLAAARMTHQPADHTLQPTALVHEAWLRLTANKVDVQFANRAHFFAAAAEAMRRILIERGRRKSAYKRGAGRERVGLESIEIAAPVTDDRILSLVAESVEKLAGEDPQAAEIVKLRFFCGLTLKEAGEAMGFTERTAKRYWAFARAWLYDALEEDLAG